MSKKDVFVAPPGCDHKSALSVGIGFFIVTVIGLSATIGHQMRQNYCSMGTGCAPVHSIQTTNDKLSTPSYVPSGPTAGYLGQD